MFQIPPNDYTPLDLFSGSVHERARHSQTGAFVTFGGPKVNRLISGSLIFSVFRTSFNGTDQEIDNESPDIYKEDEELTTSD